MRAGPGWADSHFPSAPAPDLNRRPDATRGARGEFALDKPADTFIDLTGYRKGVVWVNGHNLGRFWDIGPQFRLYCPASFLKPGRNDVVVLDLLQTEASPLRGAATLK